MRIVRHPRTTTVLAACGLTSVFAMFALPTTADDTSSGKIATTEFAQLLKDLHLKNQPWATIPWKVSVTEARQLAAREGKPIFLVVNTGNCLGWT
jgi:hypothetical protein